MKIWDFWDSELSELVLYMYYEKFSKINFEMILQPLWGLLLYEPLLFEPILVFREAIGRIHRFFFLFNIDDTPIYKKSNHVSQGAMRVSKTVH